MRLAGKLRQRDAGLHRSLHLLEGAHLDLAHPLARDAELLGELFERHRVIGEAPCLEDALSAPIKAYRAKDK